MICFVIMPFGSSSRDQDGKRKLDQIYSAWIKPTVESVPIPGRETETLTCHRADMEVRPGDIITNIVEHLVTSDIVIADLTGQNPNVFYELGVRHSVRNNTILISESIDDIPFDLRGLRAIAYRYDPEHMLQFRDSLKTAVEKTVSEPQLIDNPVRRFLCDRAIEDLMRQSAPPGYDAVRNILSEMDNLKREFRQHHKQVREVMQLVTSVQDTDAQQPGLAADRLAEFEGIWISVKGGTFCARIVDGRLYIPYCYSGDAHLTGHYYRCTTVGNSLFGRFRWFEQPISGYAFLKVESKDKASGGWWYSEDVPREVHRDISRIDDSLPAMNALTWTRNKRRKKFPRWAEEYFEKQLYLRDST